MAGNSWEDRERTDEVSELALERGMAERQRRQVERELAAQRQRLPRAKKTGQDSPPDTGGLGEPVEQELARLEGTTTEEVVRRARKDAQERAFDVLGGDPRRNGSGHA